jgi:hypothetical protein
MHELTQDLGKDQGGSSMLLEIEPEIADWPIAEQGVAQHSHLHVCGGSWIIVGAPAACSRACTGLLFVRR